MSGARLYISSKLPRSRVNRAFTGLDTERRATIWLAIAIIALPWLAKLSLDFERSVPLLLLPPALWTGRKAMERAITRFFYVAPLWRWGIISLILISITAVAMSSHSAASTVELARWILLGFGAILAGQLAAENPRHAHILLGAVALSATLGCLCHFIWWQLGSPPDAAFYPHLRLMGLHLLGGALAATAIYVNAQRSAVAWLVIGMIPWTGIFWTGSRAPLAGVLAGLAVWIFQAPRVVRRRLITGCIAQITGGLLLSTVLSSGIPGLGWTHGVQRTIAATSAKDLTSNRSQFWNDAVHQFTHSPWFGYGPDGYRFLEPKLEGAQPHNVILQSFLDIGLFGGTFVLILLARAVFSAVRQMRDNHVSAGWGAVALASVTAGQLDGFFYHQYALFTSAIALGIVLWMRPSCSNVPPTPFTNRHARLWPIAGGVAGSILLLHTWLFYRVALAPPPTIQALAPRVWNAFPSTTRNLERWIEAWEPTTPDSALNVALMAAAQSPNGDFFRVCAAGILLRRGERSAARRELVLALAAAPVERRAFIADFLKQMDPPQTDLGTIP